MSQLSGWDNFYVIMGSSAAALTGLMFVVITLVAGSRERSASTSDGGEVSAYGTPNVVHFCFVLLLCAILSAPWESLATPSILLILCGLAGVGYASIFVRRMIRRSRLPDGYAPVLEDWLWFAIFPFTAYLALVIAAIVFLSSPRLALFIMAAVMVVLVFIGIHNAWDTVTYLVIARPGAPSDSAEK